MAKIAIRFNEKRICRLPVIDGIKQDIITGINYIDAEYWNQAKEHKTVKFKIDNGILEEVKTKTSKKVIEVDELQKVKDKSGKEVEKKVKTKKEKDIKVTDFNKLSTKEKESIIEETFNTDSLNQFNENETDPSIRLKIEKRIDSIKDAKTDETIDHPKTHLKG